MRGALHVVPVLIVCIWHGLVVCLFWRRGWWWWRWRIIEGIMMRREVGCVVRGRERGGVVCREIGRLGGIGAVGVIHFVGASQPAETLESFSRSCIGIGCSQSCDLQAFVSNVVGLFFENPSYPNPGEEYASLRETGGLHQNVLINTKLQQTAAPRLCYCQSGSSGWRCINCLEAECRDVTCIKRR